MKEKYNRLFEKAAPRTSDEELFKAVLNSGKERDTEKNNASPKRKKAPMIAVIAAAAAVLATTAGAVIYNRSISDEYNEILAQDAEAFPQDYTDKEGDTVDQKDMTLESGIYEKMNIDINKSFEGDGFTLDVTGAISDGEELLIFYDIIFDEDPWWGENRWLHDTTEKIYLQGSDNKDEVVHGGRLEEGVVSECEGKTVFSNYYSLRGIDECDGTLKVTFEYLWGSHGGGEKRHRYINADIEIPITDDLTKFNKTVDIPDEPYVKLGSVGNWDLLQLEATPLGVSFSMETDEEVDDSAFFSTSHYIPIYVNFKDGSSLNVTPGLCAWDFGEENKTLWVKTSFNYPIDVDEIQSIQFVNALVDMEDGSVMTVDAPKVPFRYLDLEIGEWVTIEE